MLDSVLVTSLHCVLLAPSSNTVTGRNPVSMGGGRRSSDKDGNYLKYKNAVDEKLEVQSFKASKGTVFQVDREQYYFKVKKDDFS